jgi:hypothetical protein
MTRPTRVEVNCTTGETSIIELTDAEIEANEAAADAHLAEQAERELEAANKATARQAILDRLGLTADEAALLLG